MPSLDFTSFFQKILFTPQGSLRDVLFALILLWSLFWKGMALWKSARNLQKYWFVALLVLNTVGILEIVYISFFQKKLQAQVNKKK